MTKQNDKVIKKGCVAVLYSPEYGAGWYSWNDDKKTWLLFHPDLIEAVESGNLKRAQKLAEKFGKELYGEGDYTSVLGAKNLQIRWIPQGTKFRISEYDGFESVILLNIEEDYITA